MIEKQVEVPYVYEVDGQMFDRKMIFTVDEDALFDAIQEDLENEIETRFGWSVNVEQVLDTVEVYQ